MGSIFTSCFGGPSHFADGLRSGRKPLTSDDIDRSVKDAPSLRLEAFPFGNSVPAVLSLKKRLNEDDCSFFAPRYIRMTKGNPSFERKSRSGAFSFCPRKAFSVKGNLPLGLEKPTMPSKLTAVWFSSSSPLGFSLAEGPQREFLSSLFYRRIR